MTSLPNILTLGRVALAPLVAALIIAGWPAAAVSLFILAALLDLLDGKIARAMKTESAFGAALAPIADKILVALVLLALAGSGMLQTWHLIPAGMILLRDILISGVREYAAKAGVSLAVTGLAKWKTTAEFVALALLIVSPIDGGGGLYMGGLAALWLAGALSAYTGAQYLLSMRKAG